jgi:hypothetical protein
VGYLPPDFEYVCKFVKPFHDGATFDGLTSSRLFIDRAHGNAFHPAGPGRAGDHIMPVEMTDSDIIAFKLQASKALHGLARGHLSVADIYHPDARYWGSHPINEIAGIDAITDVWTKLRAAIPDLERR